MKEAYVVNGLFSQSAASSFRQSPSSIFPALTKFTLFALIETEKSGRTLLEISKRERKGKFQSLASCDPGEQSVEMGTEI